MTDIHPFETEFAHSVTHAKYMKPHGETHWNQTADRVTHFPMEALKRHTGKHYTREIGEIRALNRDRFFVPGGRYLYASGKDFHQVQNCLLLRCDDTREGWAALGWKSEMSLLTGAGLGVYWGDVRGRKATISRTGGTASGPVPKAVATNEQGRAAVQGGDRRAAIWGGLPWFHGDVFDWITAKDWPEYITNARAEYMELISSDPAEAIRKYPSGLPDAPLDMTNISVCLDDEFFEAFHNPEFNGLVEVPGPYVPSRTAPDGGSWHDWAQRVYWATVDHMTQTGEPGFSVDVGEHRDEKLRNACTEIVSADDSDICNLGGLVLPRFDSPKEFGRAVRLGTLFLTAGTVYSKVPYTAEQSPDGAGVDAIRDKNRRLGLDVIGIHEFLLKHGVQYGSDDAFEVMEPYMREYDRALEYAHDWQEKAGLSLSVAATSGAPTGTRGIVAESTTGWEPVSAVAYKRTVITSKAHEADERTTTYVVDPTVARLTEQGYISPHDTIEDAHSLASKYERRFKMQAYAQSHTDQAISMTINLPHVMRDAAERRAFGDTLIRYLPQLRGITVYPDGAIAGQPIKPVPLAEALAANNIVVEESEEKCASGVCGI